MTVSSFTLYIGGPGTGKSYQLKKMSKEFESHVICPTWNSATRIGGQTIYFYCGCSFVSFVPKKFVRKIILIDEIFMFSSKDMKRILSCANDDTEFVMFGDPFQLKPPNDDGYFYDAIESEIKVIHLNHYYRSETDINLQTILIDYRLSGRLQISDQFQFIEDKQQLKQLLSQNATILVGTHSAQKQMQEAATRLFRNTSVAGLDGNLYRVGQTLFTVSKYGSIKDKIHFLSFSGGNMMVDFNGERMMIQRDVKKGRSFYPVISGDVLTINIAQGQEFEIIIVDSASFFEFGSLYTAISRVGRLQNIYIYKRKGYDSVFEKDICNVYCDPEKKELLE